MSETHPEPPPAQPDGPGEKTDAVQKEKKSENIRPDDSTQKQEIKTEPSQKDSDLLKPPVSLEKNGRVKELKPPVESSEKENPSTSFISQFFDKVNLAEKKGVSAKKETAEKKTPPTGQPEDKEKPQTAPKSKPEDKKESAASPAESKTQKIPAKAIPAETEQKTAQTEEAPQKEPEKTQQQEKPTEEKPAEPQQTEDLPQLQKPQYSKRIFLIHGPDERMKDKIAPLIAKLGFKVVIFNESITEQNTLAQRYQNNRDVGFAIVLLSIEDLAYHKDGKPQDAKARVNQSVVFELGFLLGKLGRERVFVLNPRKPNYELPTNYFDVYYTPMDEEGRWKHVLTERLKRCEYQLNERVVL